jgi:tetratricopeptide (TPR) repeat protein
MKFCHHCGYQLTLGTERFCPECGQSLEQKVVDRKADDRSIGITDTKGDVFGTGFSGSGNITGKEVAYTVQGNVLNFNISGSSITQEFIEQFQKMVAVPTQLESPTSPNKSTTKDNIIKQEETSIAKQQISNVLNEVNKIEDKTGTEIQEIKAGDLQISRNELLLKEYLLKGYEYYYKKKYDEAIESYEKALAIDPNYAPAWHNKGLVLHNLGKYDEAIKHYDRALAIDPNCAFALNNKGRALGNLGKYDEAIKYYDKASEIDPNYGIAKNNKRLALEKVKKKKGWFR